LNTVHEINSLVVSISTPEANVDLYTLIITQIGVVTQTTVGIEI